MKLNVITLITCIVMFVNFHSLAQVKGAINYTLTINDSSNPQSRFPRNYLLIIADGKSLEIPLKINNQNLDEPINNESSEIKRISLINSSKISFVYKDFKKKELHYSESIFINNYLVDDTLNNFSWKIINEHKKILGYDCLKAITLFRGRKYEAWFAESIPIPNGPWKFSGLPGLILEVSDLEGKYNFKLTGIDLNSQVKEENVKIPKDYSSDKEWSYSDFITFYKSKVKDLEAANRVVTYTENGSSNLKRGLPQRLELY